MKRPALATLILLVFCWSAVLASAAPPAAPPDAKPAEAKSEKARAEKSKPAEAKPEEAKPAEAKPAERADACEVKRGPIKIEVILKSTFEARRMTPIVLRLKQWTGLSVLKAVANGQRVERGDVLVELDLKKIDEAIADLRAEIRLADIAMVRSRLELALLEKLTPMDLVAAKRNERIAKEDFDRLMKVVLPVAREQAEFYLKTSAESLAYQKEELDQLEKMYKADDLTEETEEIVLRRARDSVKHAEFSHKMAKLRHEQTMKYELPREEEGAKDSFQRETLTLDQAKAVLPLALKQAKLTLEKAEVDRTRAGKKLKELLADRAAMTVKAPIAGVVYYGKCADGSWSGNTGGDQFARGTSLAADKPFMTIVQTRPLRIRAAVEEKDLQYVRVGLGGKVAPTGYPDEKLTAVVSKLAEVPLPTGSFGAELTLTGRDLKGLMPGMTCEVKLPGYVNKSALLVPPAAIGTDPLDDERHFVLLLGKDGKSKKQPVKVGKRTEKDVEILQGLAEGQKILRDAAKAEEEKPAKAEPAKESPKTKEAKKAKDDAKAERDKAETQDAGKPDEKE